MKKPKLKIPETLIPETLVKFLTSKTNFVSSFLKSKLTSNVINDIYSIYVIILKNDKACIHSTQFKKISSNKYKKILEFLIHFNFIRRFDSYETGKQSFKYQIISNEKEKLVLIPKNIKLKHNVKQQNPLTKLTNDAEDQTIANILTKHSSHIDIDDDFVSRCELIVNNYHNQMYENKLCINVKLYCKEHNLTEEQFYYQKRYFRTMSNEIWNGKVLLLDVELEKVYSLFRKFHVEHKKRDVGYIKATTNVCGRTYYDIQNLPKIFRNELTIDERDLYSLDVSSAHINFIPLKFQTPEYAEEIVNFNKYIAGDTHSKIAEYSGLTREQVKLQNLTAINESPKNWHKFEIWKIIKKECPNIYDYLYDITSQNPKYITKYVFHMEGVIMGKVIQHLDTANVFCIGIHDEIKVKFNDVEYVQDVFKKVLTSVNLSNVVIKTKKITRLSNDIEEKIFSSQQEISSELDKTVSNKIFDCQINEPIIKTSKPILTQIKINQINIKHLYLYMIIRWNLFLRKICDISHDLSFIHNVECLC
jgi:hypothetical protein